MLKHCVALKIVVANITFMVTGLAWLIRRMRVLEYYYLSIFL